MNTSSTPKTTNGTATPKSGKEQAGKPSKTKSKKDGDKKAEKEAPKEPELTAEEKHQRKEVGYSLFDLLHHILTAQTERSAVFAS